MATTNNERDDEPSAKRQRVDALKSSYYSKANHGFESHSFEIIKFPVEPSTPSSGEDAVSDSEVLDELNIDRPTDLESALPHVQASELSIADYEAIRPADTDLNMPGDLEDRLTSRKWSAGRRSVYVDAFNMALETVLDEEGHLFDRSERAIFDEWRQLSFEAQYLYVRLFLRKTSTWHRIARLEYHSDISDIQAAVKTLQAPRALPQSSTVAQTTGDVRVAPDHDSCGSSFTFANASAEEITTLEEASSLLSLEELKSIGKEAKIHGKNKRELLDALKRMSRCQSGLAWFGQTISKRTSNTAIVESGRSINSCHMKQNNSTNDPSITARVPDQAFGENNRDRHFVRKILANIGPCIRLSPKTLTIFERVHLVYYRSTVWTEKSLITIILARIQQKNFARYFISRSANIFQSRSVLLEFERSIRLQHRVDSIVENGTPDKQQLEEVLRLFEEVYPSWQHMLADEQRKEDRVYESGEGAYLRRFSPAWVYTRIIHKTTSVLGRLKMYTREHRTLMDLLGQRLFHPSRRGVWYRRKALIEEHYLADTVGDSPQPFGMGPDQLKRHWRRVSLKTCEEGLQDRDCHVIHHYDLQKRIMKLEKRMKIPKREQHDFGHSSLSKPVARSVEGIQLRIISKDGSCVGPTERRSPKTIWIDETGNGGECSVEAMCLSWYRSQGWKGYHAEGGILRTIFAYLFYDVLFLYIPNVFQTPFQTCPLDLHTDAFFSSRASEIHRRVMELSNGDAGRLIRDVNDQERGRRTSVVGLNWDFDVDDLLEIVSCFDGAALANICMVMAQEYQQRGGGVPDLFLWNPETKQVMFSEVKSENDRLSDTQRLWIHVLTSSGIRVELCNAVAKEVRTRTG